MRLSGQKAKPTLLQNIPDDESAESLGRASRYALSVHIPEVNEAGWACDPRRVAFVASDRLGARCVDWDAVCWEAAAASP